MRALVTAALILVGLWPVRAEATGFGFGSAIPITEGMRAVNFNTAKGFRFWLAGQPVGLLEVQLSYTNGLTKRVSLLYAGPLAVRTPMTVEVVQALGPLLCLVVPLAGAAVFVTSTLRAGRAERGAAPNGGAATPSGSSGVNEGPPSVS